MPGAILVEVRVTSRSECRRLRRHPCRDPMKKARRAHGVHKSDEGVMGCAGAGPRRVGGWGRARGRAGADAAVGAEEREAAAVESNDAAENA